MSEIELRFKYAPAGDKTGFVLDIDAILPGRGVTGVFGPSASGKSTLLRCIAGLQHVENGLCIVNSTRWQHETGFVPVHQRELGYVFQHANLFEHMNVGQNLKYGFDRLGSDQRRIDFDEAVALLGLDELLHRNTLSLSGGQRQRVAIARALLCSPRLLLMDEPMASLDSDSKREIMPYLVRLHDTLEIPALYVSHSLDELLRIADHMLLMEHGRIIANGPLNELLTRDDLPLARLDEASVVYDGEVKQHHDDFHLSEVSTPIGNFLLSEIATPLNSAVRIRIAARDVSITLAAATETSISHILPAKVVSTQSTRDPAKVLVKLGIGDEFLLASITARSVSQLQLEPGKNVYAQVKSVALT